MTAEADLGSITEVLEALLDASNDDRVTVRQIVEKMGERSFAPLLLIPAMILVSPVSSIPGMPTFGAIIIALVTVQMLLGRKHLWLPEKLAERSITADRLERAVNWLRKPAAWIDRHVHQRLCYLTFRPLSHFALLTCLAVTMVMPLMEFVPALATVAAFAITLFAIGLMTRDGVFVIGGYGFTGLGVLAATLII
ncbi:hypothetical protein JT55_02950 [Rhodovulum sp. NI22]|nr:hypothetical protein JT55_02950 [Rhodovulum sp. NI22]